MRRLPNGIYRLNEFKVRLWTGTAWEVQPLYASFYYRSLAEGNRKLYDEYRELVETGIGKRVASYERFIEIYEDIRDCGWDKTSSILLGRGRKHLGNVIDDGQHRAAILEYISPGIEVDVNRRYAWPYLKRFGIKIKDTKRGY